MHRTLFKTVNKITNSHANTIANGQLNVLITRPEEKSKQLALLLTQQGIANISQPLFDYHNNTNASEVKTALEQSDVVIFVSAAAVTFAHNGYELPSLINHNKLIVIAVGQATKKALLALGIADVTVPEQEDSEGVLSLPILQNVNRKRIKIFRGNGGREHIATILTERGAGVSYIESYQRVWRTLAKDIAQQWQAQQINCIVVTSNENLMALVALLQDDQGKLINYWQHDCLWLVVSSRIEHNAKAMGLHTVVNSHGANTLILANALEALNINS